MSEKRLIAISSIPESLAEVDLSELPVMRIYPCPKEGYELIDREVISTALWEILDNSNNSTPSTIFLVVEVISRKRATPRRHYPKVYPLGQAQGNARVRRRRGGEVK